MARRLAVVLLLVSSAVQAVDEPRVLTRPGGLVLTLPPLLGDPAVRPHLETGLTTTLAWRVETRHPRRGLLRGGARIEVRFEPWDEVYHVRAIDMEGRGIEDQLASFEALVAWWQDRRPLVLVDALDGAARDVGPVRIELDVVPFSEDEAHDTRRWFSEALDDADQGGTAAVGAAGRPGNDAVQQVLHTLLATSIQRRPAVEFRWLVTVSDGEAAP